MKVIVTIEEFRYFSRRVEELILHNPEDLKHWLNLYRVLIGEIVTIENMGVEENTFHYSTAIFFINNWKDLCEIWSTYCSSDLKVDILQ